MISSIEILENNIFKNDLLDRQSEIEDITPIILNFEDQLVLALDSPWGTGKTTFVKLWQAYLKKQGKQSIYFNAWETDYAVDPLIVLIYELNKWLKSRDELNESVASNFLTKSKEVIPIIAKQAAIGVMKAVTLSSIDSQEIERVVSDAMGNITGDLIDNFSKQSEAIQKFKKIIDEALKTLPTNQTSLVIFIDELDRCRPTYAIELLERIKHLFSIPGLTFILSTDTTQLEHSIRAVYGNGFDARKYLQRFIDLDYTLIVPDRKKYIEAQFKALKINQLEFGEELKDCLIFLTNKFELELRGINLLLIRIRLILYSIADKKLIDIPLLVSLLILRDKNKQLYDKYVNSPSIVDEVIKFLFEGHLPLKGDIDKTPASILGCLFAADLLDCQVADERIRPYIESTFSTGLLKHAVQSAENSLNVPLNITVGRIERLKQINFINKFVYDENEDISLRFDPN